MSFVAVRRENGIATVVLERGKVNALNPAVVEELSTTFEALQADAEARAVILTGSGRFFSFGFDIPEFLSYTREEFASFLASLTTLYRTLFSYPKPLVAALNGHAVAGGAACWRWRRTRRSSPMATPKVSLNEIAFGSSVFAGSTAMLQFRTGARASEVLYSGAMYAAADAQELGLVSEVVAAEALLERARAIARDLASKPAAAFASIKALLRGPVADAMAAREAASIAEFVDIWYSEPTWTNLRTITIR